LTEEWFKLWLLYCIPLLFKVLQRSGSCCGCYIVYHYCLRFYREVVHVLVVILYTITEYHYCLRFDRGSFILWLLYCIALLFKVWQRGGSCCGCYIVYHYCLRFDRGGFMLWLLYCIPLLFKVLQRSGWCCGGYIVYHYCLRFYREVVDVVVVILYTITV